MKFNDKVFQELTLEFEKKGFKESKHFEHNYCFEFYKKSEFANSICVIRILYSFDNKHLSGITSRISFNNVTSILKKFVDVGTEFYDQTSTNFLHSTESKSNISFLQKIILTSPVEFELLKDKIIEHVNTYIIPIFEEISNLQKLNEKISKVPQSKYCDYIYGESNLKALIIMKLCNNPKYNEFKTWLIDTYKKLSVTEPEQYSKDYDIILNLIEYLDIDQYKKLLKA